MNRRIIKGFEVCWDGRTVWVNDTSGLSRARYQGHSNAIDVHHDFDTQLRTGQQCDACCTGSWEHFAELVQDRLGIELPEAAQPESS